MGDVVLARLGKPHGIKGWLKLHSFTSPVTNIANYQHFSAELAGRTLELEVDDIKQQGESLLAHVRGIDTPEQARELTGALLKIAESGLPPLEPGDYYWHQLLGLAVTNREDQLLGVVDHLLETGANDVLVVKPTADSIDDRERLIPYLADAVVEEVNLEQQQIKVQWPADYLE